MEIAKLFASLGLQVDRGSFEFGERMINSIHHALAGLAVFEGVKKLEEMVESTAKTAENALKSAAKLNMTAEAVQELGYAAEASHVPAEALTGALTRMARAMDQSAQKGKGPFANAMQKLGISMSDPEIKANNLDGVFSHIAENFSKLPPTANRAAIAMQLFGRTGATMIPLLNKGAAGIRELREEAWDLGIVIETETAKQFEEWEEQLIRIKGAATGLRNDAVIALLPVLRELTDNLFTWIKANRELIKQRLAQIMHVVVVVAEALAKAVAKLYEWFEKIAPIIGDVASAFSDLLGTGSEVGDGLTDIAIAVAAAWALAELPLIALAAGIAAIILIVDDLWSGMQGGDSVTKELLDSFEEYLGESGAGRVVLGLKAAFVALFDFLEAKFKWLMRMGEKIGGGIFKFIHGDTAEQVGAGNDIFSIAQRAAGLNGIDKVVTQADDTETPDIDETVHGRISTVKGTAPSTRSIVEIPPPFWNSPSTNFGPTVQSVAPQMSVNITVQGNADQQATDALVKSLGEWWGGAMRDVAVSTGARGGKLP